MYDYPHLHKPTHTHTHAMRCERASRHIREAHFTLLKNSTESNHNSIHSYKAKTTIGLKNLLRCLPLSIHGNRKCNGMKTIKIDHLKLTPNFKSSEMQRTQFTKDKRNSIDIE